MAQSVGEVALDIVAGRNTVNSVVRNAMNDVQDTVNKGSSSISGTLGKVGGVAKGVAKGMAVGIGVASTAIIGLGKQAVDAYAEYEQLVGGVETLFKENADAVIANASNAYKTAGMSANEYMTTVTSFSASLLQSLGGDTVKASEMADMAITDMSDNANKMGTSIEMIQNAYQGFAKQNYTMLDNLKLGYGGTKTEMERLLADAQAISGIQYDISSYADVVDAIHVIQTEMGITGTTAKEASSTIQGSIASMKASWTNLLTGLSDPTQNFDQLITNFVDSVTAVGENLLPRVGLVLDGIVNLISKLVPKLLAEIPNVVSKLLPSVIQGAVNIVNAIVQALPHLISILVQIVPQLIAGIQQIFNSIIQALPSLIQLLVSQLPTLIPMLIEGIVGMIVTLADNYEAIIQPIMDCMPDIVTTIVDTLMDNLPVFIEGYTKLTVALAGALPQIMMIIINELPQIVTSIAEGLYNSRSILLDGVLNTIKSAFMPAIYLLTAIWNLIKEVFSPVIDFFANIFSGAVNAIKNVFAPIVNFFSSTFSLAVDTIRTVFSAVTGISSTIWNSVKNVFAEVGNFFSGIFSKAVNVIKSVFNPIVDFFGGIWNKITGIFSRVGEVVGNAITNVVSKAVNTVLSTAVGIINGFISAINVAISAINAIPGVDISKLKKLDVPQMEKGGVLKKGQVGLLEGNGAEAVVPLEKNTGWLTKIADMLDERMAGRGTLIAPPALENVRAGNRIESHNDNQSKIDELIELIKRLLEGDNEPTPIPIYIGNELIEEYILNKNSRTVLRSGGRA